MKKLHLVFEMNRVSVESELHSLQLTNHCESSSTVCPLVKEGFPGSCLSDFPRQMFLNLIQKP